MDTLSSDYSFPENLKKEFLKKSNLKKNSQKIVTYLREGKSQEFMNQRLGFKFNQYAKWENGTKAIFWDDVLKICEIRKIKLTPAISSRFNFKSSELDKYGKHIINFYLTTFFKNKISVVAKYLEVTPSQFRRMYQLKNEIPFIIILKLFLYRPIFFLYFLNELNIIDKIPGLKDEFKKLESLEQLEAKSPFVSAVLYFIGTSEYKSLPRHNSKKIAESTGLTLTQVEYALNELSQRQLISFSNQKYLMNQIASELHTLSVEQIVKILSYWNFRSVSYLKQKVNNPKKPKTRNHTSFRVFTTTKSTADKIAEKLAQTYYEINQYIKEDQIDSSEEIVMKVFCINYFGIEESKPLNLVTDMNLGLIEQK